MSKNWALGRTVQCATCPWKVGTTVRDIPDYIPEMHESLRNTIAGEDGNMSKILAGEPIRNMSCHYSTPENKQHCIGWVDNQMCDGNNLQLRIDLTNCKNADEIQVEGPQVSCFDETFK